MAKTIKIQVVTGCIHYGKGEFVPGDVFDCEIKEAKRLKDLGVACDPSEGSEESKKSEPGSALLDAPSADQERLELLAAIATAETPEALIALIPETAPDEEIQAAFAARMSELEK